MLVHLRTFTLLSAVLISLGADYRTDNFIVTASTPKLAREIGQAAERHRRKLAQEWLGRELEDWPQPCPVWARVGENLEPGGLTSFRFVDGEPSDWRMEVVGTREQVLESVLPHEITHTIFASHFGRPLPRWAEEGACTTVERTVEREQLERAMLDLLRGGRSISVARMFNVREYPADVMTFYSQGYSLAQFLISRGGKRKFVEYLHEGVEDDDWVEATKQHYGYQSLNQLQVVWVDWAMQGAQ